MNNNEKNNIVCSAYGVCSSSDSIAKKLQQCSEFGLKVLSSPKNKK